MKTANRHLILATLISGMGILVNPIFAWADPPPSMPTIGASSTVTPKASSATGAQEIKIPDLPKPLSGDKKDAKKDKDTDTVETKVPDSVKDVIKRLNTKGEDITLDDLNAAREAVAKLDALIDIEKRLADLDKIRDDRAKEKDKKLAEAIPMAALTPPPSFAQPFSMPVERKAETKIVPAFVPPAPPADIDIVSIEGSNNRYGAIVRDGGALRMVHAGDHLSDGSTILSVTTQGVEAEKNKITHMTQIRDVQTVFGSP